MRLSSVGIHPGTGARAPVVQLVHPLVISHGLAGLSAHMRPALRTRTSTQSRIEPH